MKAYEHNTVLLAFAACLACAAGQATAAPVTKVSPAEFHLDKPEGPQKQLMLEVAASKWTAHRDWLSNPARRNEVRSMEDGVAFRVQEPSKGMKWSWTLPRKVDLAQYRYVFMEYTAADTSARGDYTLCLLGAEGAAKPGYASVIMPDRLIVGGRQTAIAPLKEAKQTCPVISGLAVQIQALTGNAKLKIHQLGFVRHRRKEPVADVLPFFQADDTRGFAPARLGDAFNCELSPVLDFLYLKDWPTHELIKAYLAPFRLRQTSPRLYSTTFEGRERLTIPGQAPANGVYLLIFAAFRGENEPVFGQGQLRAIRDVDRFRVRVIYRDGAHEDWMPYNFGAEKHEIRRGLQVLYVPIDRNNSVGRVVVHDDCRQAAFALAAATFLTADRNIPIAWEPYHYQVEHGKVTKHPAGTRIKTTNEGLRIATSLGSLRLTTSGAPSITRLANIARDDEPISNGSASVCRLRIDGKAVESDAWTPQGKPTTGRRENDRFEAVSTWRCSAAEIQVTISGNDSGELLLDARLTNRGTNPINIGVDFPWLSGVELGGDVRPNWYVFPRRGSIFDSKWGTYRARYGGDFPLQFVAAANPGADSGLWLRTEDKQGKLKRDYVLAKKKTGLTLGVSYADTRLEPGQTLVLPTACIGVGGGDWHEAFRAYRRWLRSWYRPASPRRRWFREVFNFRQRFLWAHDPLYDPATGELDLLKAVREARREFGGIEYLHLFDWGNCGKYGRIYGRTGDYSPYDYIRGGRKALSDAIAEIRQQGVRVGLYIEGYLLQEDGRLGRKAKPWQLKGPDGKGKYWPGVSEMFICPAVEQWRKIQATTYAAKVRELGVDGMYVDQFGFAGGNKDCYSPAHGHPVPSNPVVTERGMLRAIRSETASTGEEVVIYSEETPADVSSQLQDGSFTYAMLQSHRRGLRAPINLTRFAIPDFKTFEILYCDRPTGSWATGVQQVFFNGEGIWLEGPADKWFEPQTLAAIRKCHKILRKHRTAFTSDDPTPLVQTLHAGIYANRFPARGEVVYTFYNSLPHTYRGPAIQLRMQPKAQYYDAWHNRPANVTTEGDKVKVTLEIPPQGVGCLVVKPIDERNRND